MIKKSSLCKKYKELLEKSWVEKDLALVRDEFFKEQIYESSLKIYKIYDIIKFILIKLVLKIIYNFFFNFFN